MNGVMRQNTRRHPDGQAILNPRRLLKHGARLLLAMLAMGLGHFQPLQAAETPLERIVIAPGENGAQFMLKNSRTPFTMRGFNYVRLRAGKDLKEQDHSTFDADTRTTKAAYDPAKAEAAFVALKTAGYNTVRVFIIGRNKLNPGIAGDYDTTKAVYEPYMENVLDFVRRATRHGIRVLPTLGDGELPLNAYYQRRFPGKENNKTILIVTKEGVEARVEYISAFLSYIKQKTPDLLPTIIGLQCQNEAHLSSSDWPFTEKAGQFKAANGKVYDLADSASRQALADEGFLFYHASMVKAVKAIDPEMLVTEGVFMPHAVGVDAAKHLGLWPGKKSNPRYPPTLVTLGTGTLDFLDAHFYRTSSRESIEQAFNLSLGSSGFFTPEMKAIRKAKPVVIGEFGSHRFVDHNFSDAVTSMVQARDVINQHGCNGMLYWTYDCHEQVEPLHHATTDWKLFVEKMGNFERK
jgi:hypothetical protein